MNFGTKALARFVKVFGFTLAEWQSSTGLSGYGGRPFSPVMFGEDSARAVSAVSACLQLIGGAFGSLPMHIYERDGFDRKRTQHDYWYLLNERPNAAFTAAVMWDYLIQSMLMKGDAFALLERGSKGAVTAIHPVNPDAVSVKRSEDGSRLLYLVAQKNGEYLKPLAEDVLHIPGFGFDGERGVSAIRHYAKTAIGAAIAADESAARWLANSGVPPFALKVDRVLNEQQADEFRSLWMKYYGGYENSGKPAILHGGFDIKPIGINPDDAQLLETRKFQVEEIARIFGVPPFMIGATDKTTSWGSGIEQMGIGFVKYTLGRHLRRIEQELNSKLFRIERYFCEFNTAGLERGDIKSRNEAYRVAVGRAGEPGWMTQNEVRKSENLPPLPGGDELRSGDTPAPDSKPTRETPWKTFDRFLPSL